MDSLNTILENKKIAVSKSKRKINVAYEQAKEISDYIGIPIFVVMRMQKQYGHAKVARLSQWLRDYPNLDKKRAIGLAYWYLKNK